LFYYLAPIIWDLPAATYYYKGQKMNVENKRPASVGNKSSEDELKASKKILASLLLACKNLSIYPHGHTVCMNSINQLHVQVSTFLHKYGTLRFEIERERIVSKGELISEGLPDEGTLHLALFQVGIRWLEFRVGIESEELRNILIIFEKYTKLSTEPEGDIVTAFWEAQFPHMQYEVAEFSWGGDPEEMVNGITDLTDEKAEEMLLREYEWGESKTQEYPAIDYSSVVLTPQEKGILKEMIREEEEADLTSYVDALMDSLLQHREKDNFKIILEVLAEEFTGSLARRDFMVTLKILQELRCVLDICQAEIPWARPPIEEFFLKASSLESLSPLQEVWSHLDSEKTAILGQIFKHLNPQAIPTLVSLLPQTLPAPFREMLLDSIILLASQDRRPLESILNNADELLIEKLLPVIINLPGGQSLKYLIRLTRHPSSRVRHEAVKGIFSRDPGRVKDIFNLIEDQDDSIRQLVLNQLGQSRDETIEDLLLSYLSKIKTSNNEEKHLILCFRTLGKCGSARSISFLRETLFRRGWMPGFWRSALRRGAAIALVAMDIPEAALVLKDASRSLYPSLRSLVRKIREEFTVPRRQVTC
jgi:hypothetical protein